MRKVIKTLNKNNIKLNITAVYTSKQTKQILKNINKKTKVIISIFAGRMADTGKDPIPQFKKSLKFLKNIKMFKYFGQVLENHIIICKLNNLGCQIITIPPTIIEKIEKFGKSFNELQLKQLKVFKR